MTDQQNGSIIRRESSSLSKAVPSGNPLISRMAGDVLSRAKSNQIAKERIQLGDYSFRPPDPLLTKLNCSNNQLKRLDLSPTPLLTELDCGNNQLQDLDLKPTSSLESLVCRANQIKELDISQAPQCDTSKDEYDLVDPPYFCCKENPLKKNNPDRESISKTKKKNT